NMKSRQRQPGNDKTDNDWLSNIRDRLNTYAVGLSGTALQDDKLQMNASYTVSDGWTRIRTRTLPGATPDLVTTAEDFPQVDSEFRTLAAGLGYVLGPNVIAQFDYRFEKYDQVDYGLDDQAPFMGFIDAGSANAVFLRVTRPDYRAHVMSLSLRYRFLS